jgi:3-deoxy-D-manno-octulosonate 8-phosphate phosphatase (KDO 8-P phosphatase)
VSAELHNRAARIRLLALDVDGVLTDGRLLYGNGGEELKAFHTRDGLGIKMLRSQGVAVGVITARESAVVARRSAELGMDFCCQGSGDKGAALRQQAAQRELDLDAVAYMGDDLPDLAAMRIAGLALCVADAATEVRATAHWISDAAGGHGAVRQACEFLLAAQGRLDGARARFTRHPDPA